MQQFPANELKDYFTKEEEEKIDTETETAGFSRYLPAPVFFKVYF